ncbi:MAG: cytochrome C [Nitrospinota bacterium]|nr:cytochrome C [Nitrospinota bacterium]
MVNILKIVAFMVAVMVAFSGYTTYGIPLIIPAPPPVEEKISGDMTMDQFIALGEKIYNGKGTCTLCHNSLGRAPLLEPVGSVATERMADPNYKGKSKTVEEYLRESFVDPSAYVVPGFGKKGTNDTVSPMPDVSKGAISLSNVEMDAVIGYLQSIAGVEVTVKLPTGEDTAAAGGEDEGGGEIKLAANAKEAFSKFGCDACHMGPGIAEGGDMGPDLSTMGKSAGTRKKGMSAEQFIIESIIDPNAVIADGFDGEMMPDDFGDQMTVTELNMMVNAILGKK